MHRYTALPKLPDTQTHRHTHTQTKKVFVSAHARVALRARLRALWRIPRGQRWAAFLATPERPSVRVCLCRYICVCLYAFMYIYICVCAREEGMGQDTSNPSIGVCCTRAPMYVCVPVCVHAAAMAGLGCAGVCVHPRGGDWFPALVRFSLERGTSPIYHTHSLTHTPTHTHIHIHTHIHTSHTYIHTQAHTYTETDTYIHTPHTHTHTHTDTYTCVP
jgi:hypothetical protein